jgi:hypothetical protein
VAVAKRESIPTDHPLYPIQEFLSLKSPCIIVGIGKHTLDTCYVSEQAISRFFAAFHGLDKSLQTKRSYINVLTQNKPSKFRRSIEQLLRVVISWIGNHNVAITAGRLCGLIPNEARPGDIVVVLYGFNAPFLLQRHSERYYTIVGTAYISGLMEFDSFEAALDSGLLTKIEFTIG